MTKLIRQPKGRRGRGTCVLDLCRAMETLAPSWAAAEWDNVGLLAGSMKWPLRKVLLTIDLTPPVLDEAAAGRFGAIVSYHPPIFRAVKKHTVHRVEQDGLAAEALSRRIAVYSPHTALDCAPGGTNDTLAQLCGLHDVRPFLTAAPRSEQFKLVTFVPADKADTVADALFAAGAGWIGDYEKCSYRLSGEGTFFGTESTSPALGRKGRLERVAEIRLETVVPSAVLPGVVSALRKAHPYEEPAFDVYPLRNPPHPRIGQGRVGMLPRPTGVGALARRVARLVGAPCASIIGDPRGVVRRAVVIAGSAARMPFEDSTSPPGPVDVVVTGEVRHHDALHYERAGLPAIVLGHSVSERPVLRPLARRLRELLPGVECAVSRVDRDPFRALR